MPDLVLEIGTEELPAEWVGPALEQLAGSITEQLRQADLPFRAVRAYGSARRLAVVATGVAPRQPDSVVEVRGPATRQAFDAEGNYTSAAFGFARSQDVFPEELKVRRVAGGEYLFVEHPKPGRPTLDLAADIFPEAISALAFPRLMRWGDGSFRFARPIRWLLALCGKEVVPLRVGALGAGRCTRGHRERGSEPVDVPDASQYLSLLAGAGVEPDPAVRRKTIREQVRALAQAEGAVAEEDGLLETLTFLVERPAVFAGAFDPEFLSLPAEALRLVMRRHQYCFPLAAPAGGLLPRFLGVMDGSPADPGAVRAGYERALHARFADIRFFFESDLAVPLPERVADLRGVVLHERLGTLFEKTERLLALVEFLCGEWSVTPQVRATVLRAARLSKAEQATSLMRELPELQGVIGRRYALHAGEPDAVAEALAGQYLPRRPGDPLPESEPARILGIADRADTLVGYLAIGLLPLSSQDPHALRQQAAGLVALLAAAPPLSLAGFVERAYALYGDRGSGWRGLPVTLATLVDFVRLPLEDILAARGVRPDTADAVLDAGLDDVHAVLARAIALEEAREMPEFAATLSSGTRVANLIRFASRAELFAAPGEVRVDLLEDEPEQALYGAILGARPAIEEAAGQGDYAAVLRLLGELADPIGVFLDSVLIMSDDEVLRTNRLRLASELQALFLRVADFARLDVEIA